MKLLPELVSFLRGVEYAMLPIATNKGTVLVAKMPCKDIAEVRGPKLIRIDYELHNTEHGPVVRIAVHIYVKITDEAGVESVESIVLESFFNPDEDDQMHDLAVLILQNSVAIVFFDEEVNEILTKRVRQTPDATLQSIPGEARRLLMETPPGDLDFDLAKQIILDARPI